MYRRTSPGAGLITAIVSAGPIFVIGLLLGTWSADMDAVILPPGLSDASPSIVAGMVMTILAGALISGIPNVLGTCIMQRLGRHNIAMRLPVAWALAGGLAAGMPFALIDAGQDSAVAGFSFAFAGTMCALLCRCGVHWEECPLAADR